MSINLIQLNGKNNSIDYEKFERQFKSSLEKNCKEATLAFLNNFPITTAPEIQTDIAITFCIKKIQGNYFRATNTNGTFYFYNFIAPICIINNYGNSNIIIDKNEDVFIDDVMYEHLSDIQALRFGFRDYLVKRCSFAKNDLRLYPIIFIKNSKTQYAKNGLLICDEFNWNNLIQILITDTKENIVSIKKWNTQFGFDSYFSDVKLINDKASEDSVFGFLTKKKIERIAKKITAFPTEKYHQNSKNKVESFLFDTATIEELRVKESFNSNVENVSSLILIEGKAGTGKTSELINLLIKNRANGRYARFLTYNHLLVYDIVMTIKSFENNNNSSQIGGRSVMTLHKFFYNLSKSLGVLHLLTEKRIDELKALLANRILLSKKEILDLIKANGDIIFSGNPYYKLKEFLTNSRVLRQAEKEVAIDFVNFLNNNNYSLTQDLEVTSKRFVQQKYFALESICIKNIFITNYYDVLKNVLKSISNPGSFYEEFNIESKYELLATTMEWGKKYLDNKDLQKGIIPKDIYITRVNRVKGGHKKGGAIVLVDEGQDCFRDEKDILFNVFGFENLAVATGGQEQLIRHVELCKWTASNGKLIPHKKYTTGKKSYRMKKNLLGLCNFVANKFGVSFNLDYLNTDDVGELIIDTRNTQTEKQVTEVFESIIVKGQLNECQPYESLLVLINSKRENKENSDFVESSVVINEYGNIEEQFLTNELEFAFQKALENVNVFWDGTNNEIKRTIPPSYGEVRLIFYNSCRGLEAWGVTCFDIDVFFDKKRAEPDAEKYLMDDLHYTLDQRKNMYAATWTLMAMTRAIDTLYLKLANPNSILSKTILDYAKANSNSCRLLS